MSVFTLENEWLGLQASTDGAAIWRFFAKGESDEIPLMRAPAAAVAGMRRNPPASRSYRSATESVAIASRIDGVTYALAPNTDWDEHYLHGDGWTTAWRVAERTRSRARVVTATTARGLRTVTTPRKPSRSTVRPLRSVSRS